MRTKLSINIRLLNKYVTTTTTKLIQKLKKELEQQQEETQKIDQKYQKMMQACLRKSVKQVVQEYEDTIIATTPEFRDEPKIDDNIIPPPQEFRN